MSLNLANSAAGPLIGLWGHSDYPTLLGETCFLDIHQSLCPVGIPSEHVVIARRRCVGIHNLCLRTLPRHGGLADAMRPGDRRSRAANSRWIEPFLSTLPRSRVGTRSSLFHLPTMPAAIGSDIPATYDNLPARYGTGNIEDRTGLCQIRTGPWRSCETNAKAHWQQPQKGTFQWLSTP